MMPTIVSLSKVTAEKSRILIVFFEIKKVVDSRFIVK
jgi:hypothetical protein